MRSTALRAWVAALLTWAVAACGGSASRPPDIVLVTVDTLRADHCSVYGYGRGTTPGLEALAGQGVRFDAAYAPTATTVPSLVSIFTGLSPLSHGVRRNRNALDPSLATLAEALAARGYRTGAFVGSVALAERSDLARGFDVYDDGGLARLDADETLPGPHGEAERRLVGRRAGATVDPALAWYRRARAESAAPVFLWVHLMDPHDPYLPPDSAGDPFEARAKPPRSLEEVVAWYDTEVLYTDSQIRRLIEELDRTTAPEERLVVVTADHGEEFTEHGWRGHGAQIYEESVRVPLLLRWTGRIEPGRVVREPVVVTDLHRLLQRAAEGDLGAGADGSDRDPLGLLTRADPAAGDGSDRMIFLSRRPYTAGVMQPLPLAEFGGARFGREIPVDGEKLAVRWGRWKYIERIGQQRRRELYDLERDPGERLDVAGEHPQVTARLSNALARWFAAAPTRAPAATVSQELQEMLEALGYRDPTPRPE